MARNPAPTASVTPFYRSPHRSVDKVRNLSASDLGLALDHDVWMAESVRLVDVRAQKWIALSEASKRTQAMFMAIGAYLSAERVGTRDHYPTLRQIREELQAAEVKARRAYERAGVAVDNHHKLVD